MRALRPLAGLAGIVTVFYTVPLDWTAATPLRVVVLAVLGTGVLGVAIVSQVLHHLRGEEPVGLPSLALLVPLVVMVFALAYVGLESARPGELAELETRTDALYFTLQVLTTVGLGDVHAEGQVARGMVSLQMAFDVVFVAAALSVMSGRFRRAALAAPARHAARDTREDT